MKTLTATAARNSFFPLLKQAIMGHFPVKIQSKLGDLILLPQSEYEEIMETAELSLVPHIHESLNDADNDIKNGDVYSIDEVFGANDV